MTKEERAVVLFLAACLVVGSLALSVGRVDPAGDAVGAADSDVPVIEETRPLRVNVNAAGPEELERLPGIGPARAAEIVRLRSGRGNFATVDELLEVRGIGPVTLERLRPFAVVADSSSPEVAERDTSP